MIKTVEIYISSAWVDVSDYVENIRINNLIEIDKIHSLTYKGQSIEFKNAAGLGIAVGQYLRISKQVSSSETRYIYSGYITRVKQKVKSGNVYIEILPDISDLQNHILITDPPGNTYNERLQGSLPSGYSIEYKDTTAASDFDQNIKMVGRITYDGLSYADLLFDCLLIINAYEPVNYYCADIVNKVIYIASDQDTVTLDEESLIEIETDTETKVIEFFDAFAAEDELRGDGGLTPILVKPRSGNFYRAEYQIETIEELTILQHIYYDSVDYGMVVGFSDSGVRKRYTTNKITFVGD